MIYTFEQIADIVTKNPGKALVAHGKDTSAKLMLHVHGVGMESAIKKCDYFVNDDLYKVQKLYAISNQDVFGRLLQQEDMVFTAKGGHNSFGLPDAEEKQMAGFLSDVQFGLSLRKWIRNFALQAYRCDPMGIIFIEVDPMIVGPDGELSEIKAYPTYKSSDCIYDYLPNGRKLEYVCFQLTVKECLAFGIQDPELSNMSHDRKTEYFRFVDDRKDLIVKRAEGGIRLVTNIIQQNPLPNEWGRTPGFMVSDLIQFYQPQFFLSPLHLVVELADCFLRDRSVRDLQKNFHGFAKAVEPLLVCGTCAGSKYVNGSDCPACTPPGGVPTGFKLKTKPSDVARFPMDIFKESAFDFKRIFGYVTPDIESWEKQDKSLDDIEQLIEMTYWGTVRMKRPAPGGVGTGGEAITATESTSNDAPKEARLNMTADWAEKTEAMIATFLGQYWFQSFKEASIAYGRDYILKTADQLMDTYQTLRTKGAPDFTLDEALEKYYHAKYQNNPLMLAKYLKMLDVEPFPHISIVQCKGIITDFTEFNSKLYFGEWANTIPDVRWVTVKAPVLIEELKAYVLKKGLKEPAPEPKPIYN